ncbi:serpin family protein [bacterium]|nr:serpin family protein [bacterium]
MKRQSLSKICLIVAGLAILVLALQGRFSASGETNQVFDDRLVSANTIFAFKLFAEIVKQDTGKNIFISPASVAIALAMTYNGAGGETKRAMTKTLELQGMSLEEVNRANAALRAILENLDPKVQLNIANSLWARKGILFKPVFIKRNEDFYGAEVATLDFDDPTAPSTINSWVSKKTKGKINKIIENISPDAILFLINAIYFKGNWTVEFAKKKTKELPFYLLDGRQKDCPMMSQSGKYRYYEGKNFQAISLPYGDNKRVSMYIFLPNKDYSLKEFLESLNAENWKNWMSQFHTMQGSIVLPRFKLAYELNLNNALKALGMKVAFDKSRANFENMCPISPGVNVFINEVKHKTFLEVDEKGTEAAAVTSVEMRMTSIGQEFSMIVDHPFFCAIRDNETGTVLFMGSIVAVK